MSDNKTVIEVMKDGPYVVKNIDDFKNSKSTKLEAKETMALCRCGASANKPYCDGSHVKISFSGKLDRDRSKDKTVEFMGKEISILDNVGICSHAGFCDGNLKNVFWEHKDGKRIAYPDKASKEDVIRVVNLCPSGSLAYKLDGKIYDKHDKEPSIFIAKDGPYNIEGTPELVEAENKSNPVSKNHFSLCRCGASKNKPFCDGSHWNIKFKDEEN